MHAKTLLTCAALLLLTGCANRAALRFEKIAKLAGKDDYAAAARAVRKEKDLYGGNSELLYYMDLGLLYHYAGKFDSSNLFLSKAVQVHDGLFAKSVTNEALSLLTNDNARPYRGRPHEIVLLHQYLAFNYLALGKTDDALVEARQTQLFLDELKRKEGGGKGYADDGMFRYLSALAYDAAKEKDDAAISYYRAVKAYQQGPVPLPGAVAGDAFAALKAAGRESDIAELALAPSAAVSAGESEIIVVGSAGRAPALGQSVFWGTWVRDGVLVIHWHDENGKQVTEALPAPGLPAGELEKAERGRRTRSGTTVHVKFAMPQLKEVPSRTKFFTVAGPSLPAPLKTEAVTDLETLLRKHLKDNKGTILARTVARVVLRTLAAQETKSAVSGNNPLINLLLNIGTDVLADQLEQADQRACFLLPRTIQVARIPVKPGKHSLTVQAHEGSGGALATYSFDGIEVKPGQKKFIFASSLQ